MSQDLLTVVELADRLQVRPSTIRSWTRSGRLPVLRLSPKVVRYDLEQVVAALRAGCITHRSTQGSDGDK